MPELNPYLLNVLLALLFAVFFGGLSLLRREGLPNRFAYEVLALTGASTLLFYALGTPLNPIIFLVLLYLVTMRSRLLVDVGNMLAGGGHAALAERAYRLAQSLWPDDTGRCLAEMNLGVLRLRQKRLDEAAALLEGVLAQHQAHISDRHEAACRYNLGVAYQKAGQELKAVHEFNKVIDLLPGSLYARGAQAALKRRAGQQPQPPAEGQAPLYGLLGDEAVHKALEDKPPEEGETKQ
jgi:tetratricopeptide (TPR) repeat protein